jgi:hypothetical protein
VNYGLGFGGSDRPAKASRPGLLMDVRFRMARTPAARRGRFVRCGCL